MLNWEMKSKGGAGGISDVKTNFLNDDSTGTVGGTVWFKGEPYTVAGQWAAAGSVPGRNGSSIAFWGVDSRGIDYIAAAGTVDQNGSGTPNSIQLNLIRVQDSNGQQYGWDGVLVPI